MPDPQAPAVSSLRRYYYTGHQQLRVLHSEGHVRVLRDLEVAQILFQDSIYRHRVIVAVT